MKENISKRFEQILFLSKSEAIRLSSDTILPEHLMLGVLKEGSGKAIRLIESAKIDTDNLTQEIERIITTTSSSNLPSPEIEPDVNPITAKILRMSLLESRLLKAQEADSEHLFLAILKESSNEVTHLFQSKKLTYDLFHQMIEEEKNTSTASQFGTPSIRMDYAEEEEGDLIEDDKPDDGASKIGTQERSSSDMSSDYPNLSKYGIDLTAYAEAGKLDPCVGRETEIERVAQILSRRKKNNPILIGEPGVGKSAIVEGLAQRIAEKKVSRMLFNKRIFTLDLGLVVAGTKFRGQFEERIKSILSEAQEHPEVIIFIDEIHTLIGAGGAEGSMDAANMLKPALARGEFQCIGATTLDEYRKKIEKDGALERRFQKIVVTPTSEQETLIILNNLKERYEDHHNVTYTDEAIKACVTFADRYVTDRSFPDKAIDILDEVGSRTHLVQIVTPEIIEKLENELNEVRQQKINAVKSQNFELAANYRDQEKQVLKKLEEEKRLWEERLDQERQLVSEKEVAEVVSMMTGIPVQKMAKSESVQLGRIGEDLKALVIGQDHAVQTLSKAIQRSRIGLKDKNKPIGTFLFLGPTGVGKTLLAKKLSSMMFGSEDALIRIDMSEFMEKFTVSRLVGAPPGYVGYEEGGQLTEKVRRRPYSVILLDEIEKAHPDVFNLLLQVFDEGHLTDSYGRKVDFKNTVLIMTSNVGSKQLREFGSGIGFNTEDNALGKDYSMNIIRKSLNKTFSPEFINRIDEIITFESLNQEAIRSIVTLEVEQLKKRVQEIGYNLEVTAEAEEFIARKGFDPKYGARPLKRAIQQYFEDRLAEKMLASEIEAGNTLRIVHNKTEDTTEVEVGQ